MSLATPAPREMGQSQGSAWLFGPRTDLLLFSGSAAVACVLSALFLARNEGAKEIPLWLWVGVVLLVDVAHVFSTLFRVYLDPAARRRDPRLYWGAPAVLYCVGFGLFALGSHHFWRVLAYAAVFHFVRQQYGFVKLYQRRAQDQSHFDHRLDALTIYTATAYPIAHWHANLPKRIAWFMEGDFVRVLSEAPMGRALVQGLEPVYWAVLVLFMLRQAQRQRTTGNFQTGKVLLVLSTWFCWWFGIIATDNDAVFTLTNVLIHGIPYAYLTYRYGRTRALAGAGGGLAPMGGSAVAAGTYFTVVVALCALAEEFAWDRWVFGDHPALFGEASSVSALGLNLLVPLLALPQATHYVLDGFIWRGHRLARDYSASNPGENTSI